MSRATAESRQYVCRVIGGLPFDGNNDKQAVPLTVVKAALLVSDPVNGTSNPKAIPGAIVEYQIVVANPATGPVDSDTVFVTDPLPAEVGLRVADLGGGVGPVSFTDGTPSSGLDYTFSSLSNSGDDLDFSNDGGATWTYAPVADGNGIDTGVNAIRVNPKGAFNGGTQFTLKFRVKIK